VLYALKELTEHVMETEEAINEHILNKMTACVCMCMYILLIIINNNNNNNNIIQLII